MDLALYTVSMIHLWLSIWQTNTHLFTHSLTYNHYFVPCIFFRPLHKPHPLNVTNRGNSSASPISLYPTVCSWPPSFFLLIHSSGFLFLSNVPRELPLAPPPPLAFFIPLFQVCGGEKWKSLQPRLCLLCSTFENQWEVNYSGLDNWSILLGLTYIWTDRVLTRQSFTLRLTWRC